MDRHDRVESMLRRVKEGYYQYVTFKMAKCKKYSPHLLRLTLKEIHTGVTPPFPEVNFKHLIHLRIKYKNNEWMITIHEEDKVKNEIISTYNVNQYYIVSPSSVFGLVADCLGDYEYYI